MAEHSTTGVDQAELSALFSAPPDEFIAARNDLAKRLAADGEGETAERVRRLRKPTSAAWLVNQLSRHAESRLQSWLELVDRLGDAKAGGDELREVAHEEGDALADLVARARAIAEELGQPASESTVDKVRETLQAAAVEPEVRSLVADGRLDRERRAASVGFGALTPGPGASKRAKKPSAAGKKAVAKAKRDLASAEKAEARAASAVEKLEGRLDDAREQRAASAGAVKDARSALDKAERAAR